MAVPSIANINPASSHTGGGALVRILGGGFNTGPDVAAGESPSAYPPVEVYFGDSKADWVAVANRALMYVRSPVSPLSAARTGSGAGVVDVTIRNLDATGTAVPGEAVTVADAFTFVDLKLTAESDLTRVVRKLIAELQRQLITEVVLSPHTDYDAETGDALNIVETAKLPALALIGPQLEENRLYSRNELDYTGNSDSTQVRLQRAYTCDVLFDIMGVSDKTIQLINLQAAVIGFFVRNAYIVLNRDPNGPSAGTVQYELHMEFNAAPALTTPGDDANLKSFMTRVRIIGFDVAGLAGFDPTAASAVDATRPVDDTVLLLSQLQPT